MAPEIRVDYSARIEVAPTLDRLSGWLASTYEGNHRFLGADTIGLKSFWLEELQDALATPGAALFMVGTNESPLGIAVYKPLAWETNLLRSASAGVQAFACSPSPAAHDVARSLVGAIVAHARREKVSFLSARAYVNQWPFVHALEHAGFLLADTLLDYVIELGSPLHADAPPGYAVRLARAEDVSQTVELVQRAFAHHIGRFHSDAKVRPDEADRIYPAWVESSFGGYADHIVVAVHNERIVGCSIWKKPSKSEARHNLSVAHFSLGVVAPECAGLGIFRAITLSGLALLQTSGVRWVEGPTHVLNFPVQRAYTRMGWRMADARHAFHLWLDR